MSDATRHAMQGLISKNQIMGGRERIWMGMREEDSVVSVKGTNGGGGGKECEKT